MENRPLYGYRYYNASTGRWISRDPAQEKGGLNLYTAAQNDLEDRIDALGEYTLPIQVHPDYDPSYFTKKEVGLFAAYGTLDPGKPVPCGCGYRTKGWSINFIGHIWIKRGHSPNGDKDLVGQTTLQHEMGHAKSYENYLTAMEGILKTMSSGCFTPLCYYGWQKYYLETDTYWQAQMNLDAAQLDCASYKGDCDKIPGYTAQRDKALTDLKNVAATVTRICKRGY